MLLDSIVTYQVTVVQFSTPPGSLILDVLSDARLKQLSNAIGVADSKLSSEEVYKNLYSTYISDRTFVVAFINFGLHCYTVS